LIIIDGVEAESSVFGQLNPSDIESINFLKQDIILASVLKQA
jgi:hypothetical protein